VEIIPDSQLALIRKSITEAEKKTSAEIRVLIEEKCKGSVLDRSAYAFRKLKMHKTRFRNGTLIYVSVKDKQCAIIGDYGINRLAEKDFWKTVLDEMIVFLSAGQLTEGIIHAVQRLADKLAEHFPANNNNPNELPDEVVTKL
jgi:uncharacterized membrane protein